MGDEKSDFLKSTMDTIRYLNSAECTSRIQKFFGVEMLDPKKVDEERRRKSSATTIDDGIDKNRPSQFVDPLRATPKDLYRIHNRLAYYMFKFGSLLGQEEFYISFFPFWFWNFDGPTGRKFIILWAISMYIGQFVKEYLRWPRPKSPPVVYLEKLFLSEYGMPSTHAIVSACLPFAVVYFEKDLCNLSFLPSFIFVASYILLVCSSRLYNGVHTVIEVLTGLFISLVTTLAYVPFADDLDHWMMNSQMGATVVVWICIASCLIYPTEGRRWTAPWADTVSIMAVCAGIIAGSWLGFRTGAWSWKHVCLLEYPDGPELLRYVLRTTLGLSVILCTRFIVKPAYYTFAASLHGVKFEELKERQWTRVEFPAKFLTYFAIAFNVCFLMPTLFVWLGLNRY